jgi:hypothetical protein
MGLGRVGKLDYYLVFYLAHAFFSATFDGVFGDIVGTEIYVHRHMETP